MVAINQYNNTFLLKAPNGKPIIMDGATGSEVNRILEARGIKKDDAVQKGSAFRAPLDAPKVLQDVHKSYIEAGADIIIADTFNASVSRQNGDVATITQIIEAATESAKKARDEAGRPEVLIAGSLTSSGDCYTPADTPEDETLIEEHGINVDLLVPHVDFVMVETIPTLREAKIIATKLEEIGKPYLINFVPDHNGNVLDGSSMQDAVQTILEPSSYCLGLGVNCCTVEQAKKSVVSLKTAFNESSEDLSGKHITASPNGFIKSRKENAACSETGCDHGPVVYTPQEFGQITKDFVEAGATVVGGCCGSGPAHIQAVAQQEYAVLAT